MLSRTIVIKSNGIKVQRPPVLHVSNNAASAVAIMLSFVAHFLEELTC